MSEVGSEASDVEVDSEDELLMHSYATLPNQCKKFWKKRYLLWSKFDEGVYMTSDMWFSVTPETTARAIAYMVQQLIPGCRSVLDICCGSGGNLVQFASVFDHVVGVDINKNNVLCAKHNCAIYGVEATVLEADWREISSTPDFFKDETFDFVFCSPPWGGPTYKKQATFDLQAMTPFSLSYLCESMSKYCKHFGIFLPRSLDFDQIRDATRALGSSKTRVVCLWQNELPLGIFAVFGPSSSESLWAEEDGSDDGY